MSRGALIGRPAAPGYGKCVGPSTIKPVRAGAPRIGASISGALGARLSSIVKHQRRCQRRIKLGNVRRVVNAAGRPRVI